MGNIKSVAEFRRASEDFWRGETIRADLWGGQIQPGTRWISGLSDGEIEQYEADVGARFPHAFRDYLSEMNGTDMPRIDVRGGSGKPRAFIPGFYSYPRDIELVRLLIADADSNRTELQATLLEQGFQLPDDARLVPIFAHRYVVCTSDPNESAVVSIWSPSDAIVYGCSLLDYLEREVLSEQADGDSSVNLPVGN